ncbi:helix-turn-helix domain-containing protein [Microaerobacter geothermalis]|uniref:helix-turn-helix domain-containing protein n=1 Tax=Microaerobacter geothermalis TaxID=674972 RepID=UPI001F2B03A3|nr:helix-turn-helix transcriptional regulator [Microaerobacter geothermalis]MCF6094334.1 helix-turn-helix domain-containing protein [Microaerobacter geothermalis]
MRMFGKRLRELRKREGLTMKQLGEKINLAESTISGYENGNRKPDMDIVERFADFFGESVDYLLGRIDSQRTEHTEGLAFYGGGENLTEEELEYLKESLELFRKMKARSKAKDKAEK